MTNKAILHVGADKCGSSSLQLALSRRPAFSSVDGGRFRYGAVSASGGGHLLHEDGDGLISAVGYAVSEPFSADMKIEDVVGTLANLVRGDATLVLSCEGWFRQAPEFRNSRLLERAGIRAKVIAFVRPQVEWLNSAWWQWGVWMGEPQEEWMRQNFSGLLWADLVRDWQTVPGVSEVSVSLATKDVVASFFGSLGAPPPVSQPANVSLPQSAYDFLLRHRDFRPGAHSPEVEFVLARWGKFSGRKADWVISPEFARSTVKHFEENNRALLSLLSSDDAKTMRDDARWWDGSHWDGRQDSDREAGVSEADRDVFTQELLHALLNADAAWRSLQPR